MTIRFLETVEGENPDVVNLRIAKNISSLDYYTQRIKPINKIFASTNSNLNIIWPHSF